MDNETRRQVRKALEEKLDQVERIAKLPANTQRQGVSEGMLKAIRLLRWQLIGEGKSCVITLLDPRWDDEEFIKSWRLDEGS